MKKLGVKYLGLDLKNPVIASSSPLTASAAKIAELEQHGAGAVVLKSIFEEQINGESAALDRFSDYPEAADYLNSYVQQGYLKNYWSMISEAKKQVKIPLIASINCTSSGQWTDFARQLESSGCDALELNIFNFPAAADDDPRRIEQQYLDTVASVVESIKIPVAVKLGMRFTNILAVARDLNFRGAKGVVMYNRFFEPDIDINNLQLATGDSLSSSSELRNALRMVGLCSAQVPGLDISVSCGLHSGSDAIKSILAGATTVQICSTLYTNGLQQIERINKEISGWMDKHDFSALSDFRGLLNYKKDGEDSELYQRVQYMKFFPKQQ